MVLYSRGCEEWPVFIGCLLKERPKSDLIIFFLCFGRGTSVARRDHGGGLALSESYEVTVGAIGCRNNPKSAMKTAHH